MATERVFPGSAPAAIGRGLVASSFQYYLTGDEALRVTVISLTNAGPVDIAWRTWSEADRRIVLTRQTLLTTDPAPSTTTQLYTLDAGALLNLRVALDTTPRAFPLLWVRVQLVRGFTGALDVIGTLLQGYLGGTRDLAWPGSPLETGDNVRGAQFSVTGAAGGFSSTITVPTQQRWAVQSGRTTYQASAVVTSRRVYLECSDSVAQPIWVSTSEYLVTANEQARFAFGSGISPSVSGGNSQFHLALPADLELSAGYTIAARVLNAQAGDAFTELLVNYRVRVDV